MQGARPPRSGIGILVPNKHQLLLPQTMLDPCCFFLLGDGGEFLLSSLGSMTPSSFKGIRSTLKPQYQCPHERENTPDLRIYIQPSWGCSPRKKGGKEE